MTDQRLDSPFDFNLWLTTIPGIPADWGRPASDMPRRMGGQASLLRRHRGLPKGR
ncbi:hypothetical protein [Novosphingobium sp.]|uniref:hypothetical protein n=1 Tax=Novosphingobium sp. TaxID=1874826 RepID=UPI0035AE1B60